MDTSGIRLVVNGSIYSSWLGLAVDNAIDKVGGGFSISAVERNHPGINRFDACQILVDGELVLTGYVTDRAPHYDGHSRGVEITGRTKLQDLVECCPDISSGQFKGYTLAAIARAICALFGIGVVVEYDPPQKFPDATLQRGETGFLFLERLGRLAGTLLSEDENGNLVLTRAGVQRAAGVLQRGVNIKAARAKMSGEKRFSQTIIKGQRAIGSAAGQSQAGGGEGAAPAPVATNLRAVAVDPLVPRYRPKVCLAEAQMDLAGMQMRANWMRNYAFGRSTEAEITVYGWRDAAGELWRVNRIVAVVDDWLDINRDLLIVSRAFRMDDKDGRITTLKVAPPEGYTPDPGQVKAHCRCGGSGRAASSGDDSSANQWEGPGT